MVMTMTMASRIRSLQYLSSSSGVRWAAGGWMLFITENLILSENRTALIEKLGDANYHNLYGICSTSAVGSIVYAYFYNNSASVVRKTLPLHAASFAFLSMGLTMASQLLPKLQIPVALDASKEESVRDSNNLSTVPTPVSAKSSAFQVRCPFDFANPQTEGELWGTERVTRHAGLWSMAITGLGQACLASTLPHRVWWSMPTLMALIGGWHTDSRFERGMGGTLSEDYKAKTSNIPFAALIAGKQESGAWESLLFKEIKPLNALLATSLAAFWVMRRKGSQTTISKAFAASFK
mmetsp:Transcript_13214/g.15136  ORF Transcript_13214/g.15136 Transcript_13214/m.15136 type:complete len:294 (+) Transcript_13214:140-1021(+)